MPNGISRDTWDKFEDPNDKLNVLYDLTVDIHRTVKGEGKKDGLLTRIALTEQSTARLWWLVGFLSLTIAGYTLRDIIL